MFVSKIVQKGVCEMCFLKVILKRCLCNDSRLYKNTYKVLSFENVSVIGGNEN